MRTRFLDGDIPLEISEKNGAVANDSTGSRATLTGAVALLAALRTLASVEKAGFAGSKATGRGINELVPLTASNSIRATKTIAIDRNCRLRVIRKDKYAVKTKNETSTNRSGATDLRFNTRASSSDLITDR